MGVAVRQRMLFGLLTPAQFGGEPSRSRVCQQECGNANKVLDSGTLTARSKPRTRTQKANTRPDPALLFFRVATIGIVREFIRT